MVRVSPANSGSSTELLMQEEFFPSLFTVKEAMVALRVGRTKLYDLINSGQLLVVKFGPRSTRIKAESVRRLIANGVG